MRAHATIAALWLATIPACKGEVVQQTPQDAGPPQDAGGGCAEGPAWSPMNVSGHHSGAGLESWAWTGSELILWGGCDVLLHPSCDVLADYGARYAPATDTWTPMSANGAPRALAAAAWASERFVVWGGCDRDWMCSLRLGDGATYAPATDTWRSLPSFGAPPASYDATAVSTGQEVIFWTGTEGAVYHPVSDTWTAISARNAPLALRGYTAIWTGSRMIVWGGYMPGDLLNIGGMYDPVSNTWQRTTQVAAPEARERHTAAWTGTRMIVWGGDVYALGGTRSGALYDPKADSWTPMSESGAPPKWVVPPRAIWAGDRFFVFTTPTEPLSTPTEPLLAVASYDPAMDRWTPHSIEGGPSPRFVAVRVAWDGCRLVLWGGDVVGDSITPRGWLYTPPRE